MNVLEFYREGGKYEKKINTELVAVFYILMKYNNEKWFEGE